MTRAHGFSKVNQPHPGPPQALGREKETEGVRCPNGQRTPSTPGRSDDGKNSTDFAKAIAPGPSRTGRGARRFTGFHGPKWITKPRTPTKRSNFWNWST